MKRICIVDTNVLVSGLISAEPGSPTSRIVDAMLDGSLIHLVSPALLAEYRAVLLRPKLARLHGLDEAQIDALLTEIVANAMWREATDNAIHEAPDPGDDHLWALLAGALDSILVTGDRLLLDRPRPGSVVITPTEFIDLWRAPGAQH
jgi:putative PIN family toxin of toxin-antitoxin system